MAAITKEVDEKLDSLASVADSGELGGRMCRFIRLTVNGVYAAPGNFESEDDMLRYLETLNELISTWVHR